MSIAQRLALRVPAIRRLRDSRDRLAHERDHLLKLLAERTGPGAVAEAGGPAPSPFLHSNTAFDPMEVMCRHAATGLTPRPGYLTNFLGVVIDPAVMPEILTPMAGTVETVPHPANWHADMAEFGAALRAVDFARDRFVAVELGCGWGCWMTITGVAARRAGLETTLIGVEGDERHLRLARETTAANGFPPDQVSLHRGIAATTGGVALFPRQGQDGGSWGLEPVFQASEAQRAEAVRAGAHEELPMIALADILAPHRRVDLLHVDIQGGETSLLRGALPLLREKVAYVVVGTHSRPIEGQLFELLSADGWRLDIERPAILNMHDPVRAVTVDGVQGWWNPALFD